MKNIFSLIFIIALFAVSAFGHQAFTLLSAQKKTVTDADVLAAEKERTDAAKEGTTLIFTQKDIRILIVTGPVDDMLSYRVLGVRNPTLVIRPGATLRILFVNRD